MDFLNDDAGEVNENLYASDDNFCRDAYDAFDALETRDESSGKIPEAKVIPKELRTAATMITIIRLARKKSISCSTKPA